jgi:hypothetical protein
MKMSMGGWDHLEKLFWLIEGGKRIFDKATPLQDQFSAEEVIFFENCAWR